MKNLFFSKENSTFYEVIIFWVAFYLEYKKQSIKFEINFQISLKNSPKGFFILSLSSFILISFSSGFSELDILHNFSASLTRLKSGGKVWRHSSIRSQVTWKWDNNSVYYISSFRHWFLIWEFKLSTIYYIVIIHTFSKSVSPSSAGVASQYLVVSRSSLASAELKIVLFAYWTKSVSGAGSRTSWYDFLLPSVKFSSRTLSKAETLSKKLSKVLFSSTAFCKISLNLDIHFVSRKK